MEEEIKHPIQEQQEGENYEQKYTSSILPAEKFQERDKEVLKENIQRKDKHNIEKDYWNIMSEEPPIFFGKQNGLSYSYLSTKHTSKLTGFDKTTNNQE